VKPNSNTALGITYRHHIDLPIDSGRASFSVPSSLQDQYPAQAFHTLVPLPKELNIGFSYQPQEQLLLSFEVQWVGWSRFDSLVYAFPEVVRNLPLYPERAYRNTFTFRVGGEYRSSERVQIRAGAYYDSSPIPRLRLSPELPDATAIGLSTGLGIRLIGGLSLDASLVYEYTGDRTDSFSAAAFSGVYRSTQLSFGLGLGYQF
ncbi:MAG: outer membrane protein transport protein, partial [Bacteroidota bacterium]